MNLDALMKKQETPQEGRESFARKRDLERILAVIRKINTSLVLSEVLELVIDEAIRITNAERGFLMLGNADGKLEFVVGRDIAGASIPATGFRVSSSVLDDVYASGESMCIENALHDERFERRESIMNLELQTILCSPLKTQDETIGVIYVDSRYIQPIDKAEILNLFEILAGQAAIAIKNARLYDDVKRAYDDLKHANNQIIRFERMAMKGELAAEVSHELKNHIAIVILALDVIERRHQQALPADVQSLLGSIRQGAKRIQAFSQSLLTPKRTEAKLTSQNPNKVITDFVEFIRSLPKFKRHKLVLTLDQTLPELMLDTDQMHQVFLNLANNAVETGDDVAVEFSTRLDHETQMMEIRVKDNGPGIDEALLGKILLQRITTKPTGHGYGLSICRQIIEQHGGVMRVESSKGNGACFIMTFPLQREL